MATSFNGVEIPPYPTDKPLKLSSEHYEILKKRGDHSHDPLGDIYESYKNTISTAPIIKEMNIPKEITDFISSFLPCTYSESTWECPRTSAWWHSNPTINYGSEAMLIFTPPIQTKLPSNSYTLDKVRYKLGDDNNATISTCKLFVGIQVFDINDLTNPGEGEMIYAQIIETKERAWELMVEPEVDLKCGRMYIFWLTAIEGRFNSSLINGSDEKGIECREAYKISNCNLNYYATRWATQYDYRIRYDFMTCYEAFFSYKM